MLVNVLWRIFIKKRFFQRFEIECVTLFNTTYIYKTPAHTAQMRLDYRETVPDSGNPFFGLRLSQNFWWIWSEIVLVIDRCTYKYGLAHQCQFATAPVWVTWLSEIKTRTDMGFCSISSTCKTRGLHERRKNLQYTYKYDGQDTQDDSRLSNENKELLHSGYQ